MKTQIFIVFLLLTVYSSFSQIGVGTTTPSTSSLLDVSSTTKGVLIPRMTQAQRNTIVSPSPSLLIFQIDGTTGYYYYNSTNWVQLHFNTNASDLYPGSLILTSQQKILLNNMYGNLNQKWVRCYSKTIDGASSATFHSNCDYKGPTMTVIKLSNNYIFGGFNSFSWYSNNNGYKSSNNSFIFSLIHNSKHPLSYAGAYSTYNHLNYGPTFGGGHDIFINNNMNLGYTKFPYTYSFNGVISPSGSGAAYLTGNNYPNSMTVTELEVWVLSY